MRHGIKVRESDCQMIIERYQNWLQSGGQAGQRADLSETNFSGRNLQGVNLEKAWLRRACLERANLRVANLKGADLRETSLRKASLQWTMLMEAIRKWPVEGSPS